MQKHINMEKEKQILNLLKDKSSIKQKVYQKTKEVLLMIQRCLKSKALRLNGKMREIDENVEVVYSSKGKFEAQLKFSGDTLLFNMHSNVFDFPDSHSIHKNKYVKEDRTRVYCGIIHIYNFLSDSLKYNRLNDEGYLIARVFVNKDNHFFVEGDKQLGFLFDDFVSQEINTKQVEKIIDETMLFALNFDIHTPNISEVRVASVQQILELSSNQKIKTAKRLGYQFSNEE